LLTAIEDDHYLAVILNSIKKLLTFIVLIAILAAATVFAFEIIVSGLPEIALHQIAALLLVFVFGLPVIFLLKNVKSLLSPQVGPQAATLLKVLSQGLVILSMFFMILSIFRVELTALLASAGIISVTVGLVISTFVGGILSGALVFTTHKLKIGDRVMINNIPGKVASMTALVTRIRTDVGQITIPNSAIASGGVIVTMVLPQEPGAESRLPYRVGDKVITSYRYEEGTVKELTEYHTTVRLNSGAEITFLNNAVLTGATAIAKVTPHASPN